MHTADWILWLIAYLVGSIPFGVLIARAQKVDIRQHGSGNIGATNIARTLGKTKGALTLLGDCGKGVFAVFLATWMDGSPLVIAGAGLSAFLGHLFPVYLKFKGGKGVATGLGIFLCMTFYPALCAVAVFAVTLFAFRFVSVSSMSAALALPVFAQLLGCPAEYVWTAGIVALLVVIKHKGNIERLMAGTEPRWGKK